MIHTIFTPRVALLGLSASLLSVALVGCGSNNATDATTAPDTAAPAMTNAAPPDAMASNAATTNAATTGTTAKPADFTAASATWTKIEVAKADLDKVIAPRT